MLSLADKVGQVLMAGFAGLAAPAHILEWLAAGRIGGVYLFARNIESPAQIKRLIAECRATAKHPIMVGIDQEGGIVARLRDGFSESPGAMALGAAGDRHLAEDIAFMMGRELAALGINWNFAPVADIARNSDNPSVGARSVGRDPQLVGEIVAAQVHGLQRGGVAATVKHFPGLGNTVIDTHDAAATVSDSLSYLYEEDLLPFRAAFAADVGCVMLTHVIYEELDDKLPATLSPRIVVGLLRAALGYDGAVCTDCMEMKAITDAFSAGESAVLSLLAGVDMILFSHTRESQEAAYDALLRAATSGRITEERIDRATARIGALKRRFPPKDLPLEIVGSEAHRSLARGAARAGLVLVKRGAALPIAPSAEGLALIEFCSRQQRDSTDAEAPSRFAAYLSSRRPRVNACLVDPAADAVGSAEALIGVAGAADTVILVTRNAHLQPPQLALARLVCDKARKLILICARNPYDAGLITGADSVICTNGDSAPSIRAAVDALCGDFIPAGNLTVNI